MSAALVDTNTLRVGEVTRLALDADAPAPAVIVRLAEAAQSVDAPRGAAWGVAMPDPFDYERGIGLFEGVGKFGALRGFDVGTALREAIGAGRIAFLNDADAFLLGEWAAGAARGIARCAGLTLGTGIGSAWLVRGEIVDPGTPPGGRIHRMTFAGRPLEDTVSRRAIRTTYGDPAVDVREISALARAGDERASAVLHDAFTALGSVVGGCLAEFGADVLVIGGSMAASWDVFEPAFSAGARRLPEVRIAADADRAGLVGAAVHASRTS